MFRRTVLRLNGEYGGISGDKGHMTLQQACTIFGFQLNEEWSKKEVKTRYKKLALKFHPDNGGTNEQFQALKEAQQIVLSHRHDKGQDRTRAKGEVKFHRVNYDDMTNTIHRQTADREEYRSFGFQDFVVFFCFIAVALSYYMYRVLSTQRDVLRGRWSYTEEQLHEDRLAKVGAQQERAWHPWRTDTNTRDRMDEVGLMQGNIKPEVVAEKRRNAPIVYTPWHSGGPFASGMPRQKYGDDDTKNSDSHTSPSTVSSATTTDESATK